MFSKTTYPDMPPKTAPDAVETMNGMENGIESDVLPPGTSAAPKGSVLLEEI
jgi:hypothetical protein